MKKTRMINSEEDLSNEVVKVLSLYGDVSKVESKLTSAGIPDLNFESLQTHNWLELKFVKCGSNSIGIRATQFKWFRDRIKAGGNPYLLVHVQETGLNYLVRGAQLSNENGLLESIVQLERRSLCTSNSLEFVLGSFIVS